MNVSRLLLIAPPLLIASQFAIGAEDARDVIDRQVAARWTEKKVSPAAPASDAAFLRRLYLDLCGTIPTAEEAAAFLDDEDPRKRTKLIDRLLADPRYAQHQADIWDMIFFGRNPPGYQTDRRSGFQDWLRERFAQNTPYDEIARAILKAEGSSLDDGAAMFFVQYKNRPEDATEKITQTFLGVQLQCARCHDHPFEDWTQLDFYGTAAFFARLEVVDLGKKKDNETAWAIGETNVGEVNFTGPVTEDEPGKKGVPVAPKFLHGEKLEEPSPPEGAKKEQFKKGQVPPAPKFSRKNALADWITADDNPYFARAVANRVWAQFMGRGLIHPVDDMGDANDPSHPELLDELTKQLVAHNFDLRWFIRELVHSKTYQLSSIGEDVEEHPRWFQFARSRPLSAEELVRGWRVAMNYAAADQKTQVQLDKGDTYYPLGDYQKQFFGKPTDGTGNFLGGMHEQLYMNNGGIDKLLTTQPGGLIHTVVETKKDLPWEERIEYLYLSILSRRPTPAERQKFVEFFDSSPDSNRAHDHVRDAVWVLMTCSEFRFNH